MAEQRKHHRVPVSFEVKCVPGDGPEFAGTARDISLGGMFVECQTQLAFGTSVNLILLGVAAREVRVPAIVRWAEARGFGVQFGLLGAYATHVLVDLVKKNR